MRIFISYRRSDTQHFAGRVADRLRTEPGIDGVFIDVQGITPGEDFESRITTAIAESSICLLLVGMNWLGRTKDNESPRILDERDFVRLEARAALSSGRRVIPVLVEDAAMPSAEELPEDLRQLPRLSAVSVRHVHFDNDMRTLIDAILGRRSAPGIRPVSHRRQLVGHLLRGLGGLAIAALVLVGAATVHYGVTDGRSLDESLGGSDLVWLLIIVVLVTGALTPSAIRRLVGPHR